MSREEIYRAGVELELARKNEKLALTKLAQLVTAAVADGMSEAEAARVAGVDRMTVRKWLGKR